MTVQTKNIYETKDLIISGGLNMSVSVSGFFKVIVVRVDVFDSEIIDERHFADQKEASAFCENMKSTPGITAMVISM